MKKIFMAGLLIICIGFTSCSRKKISSFDEGSIKQKTYREVIKYRLIHGKMLVPVTIHGKNYNFIFDTGAPLSISKKIYEDIKPDVKGEMEISDGSGKVRKMPVISLPELELKGITFTDTSGILLHDESIRMLKCMEADGIIGSNMLRNSVIQIDGRSKEIVITDNADKLGLKNVMYQEVKFAPGQSNPHIMVAVENRGELLGDMVLIDTGSREFYSMSNEIYGYYKSKGFFMKVLAQGNGSFVWGIHGNESSNRHYVLNIPGFNLYKSRYKNVIVQTVADDISRIGSKVFEYGKVTIDYRNKQFYYEAYKNVKTDSLSERPWQISPTMKNGKLVVGVIWDKSLEKKINPGDEVLGINNMDFQSLSSCELLFTRRNSATGKQFTVKLKDIKTGETKTLLIRRL